MPGGNPLSVTDKLRSSPVYTNLLLTLERLAKNGADDFYQGQVGADLVRDLEGVITMSDLNDYQVVEREPIETIIGQYRVIKYMRMRNIISPNLTANNFPAIVSCYELRSPEAITLNIHC